MKKILVFVQSNVGGAERMAVTVTKSLPKDKFKMVYCLVDMVGDGKNPILDFIPNDIDYIIIDKCNPLFVLFKIKNVLSKYNPDIVFSSTFYLNNKILLWRKWFSHINFIIRCENYLYTYTSRQKALLFKTYKKADFIIAQTEEMKDELLEEAKINKNKVIVFQNPIDTDTIERKMSDSESPYNQEDEALKFVASGRFSYQKGFDLLVDAFAIVKQRSSSPVKLYILGETGGEKNPEYLNIKDKIKYKGLANDIICLGYQDNPYKYVSNSDCFVLSSRWEGLPNVVLEALYLKKPVAAFRCIPVIERIIKDGYNGYTAEKENTEELANAMLKAAKLKEIHTEYKPARIEDFHYMFEHCKLPPRHGGGGIIRTTKNWIKSTPLYEYYRKRTDSKLYEKRKPYIPLLRDFITPETTIISSNCFAGRIMQDLGMQYNSPTLGLYIWYPDYIEMLSDLKYYMTEARITFVEHSKYPLGDLRREKWSHWYPIGLLGGKVEIAFLHYYSEEEAAEKWYRRAARINWDDLLIIGMDQNLCQKEDVAQFDKLKYNHKIFFSRFQLDEIDSNIYMAEFAAEDSVGDPYKYADLYYKKMIEIFKMN